MSRASEQGLAAAQLAEQTRQHMESVKEAQAAIDEAQRQIAERNGGR